MSEEESREVRIERRPVLQRRVDNEGRIRRGVASYIRTERALSAIPGTFVGFFPQRSDRKPTRVRVDIGIAGEVDFLLSTGHGVGLVDWTVAPEDLARLRKWHRKLYRRLRRRPQPAPAPPTSDEEAQESGACVELPSAGA